MTKIDSSIYIKFLKQGIIPAYPPSGSFPQGNMDFSLTRGSIIDELTGSIRDKFTVNDLGMYAIVDLRWTFQFAKWIAGRRVLEVMAGRGWLAEALAFHDVDITATDDYSWYARGWGDPVYDVLKYDAVEAVKSIGSAYDILLMSWAPYSEPVAARACAACG